MNNKPEAVIVTIGCINENIFIDMELPVKLPVSKIKIKVLEVLKNVYKGIFSRWTNCNLIYENHFLSDEENLNTAGIYDGSYIYIVLEG
jgi:uncharacterized ubiquitin-like protein YukD